MKSKFDSRFMVYVSMMKEDCKEMWSNEPRRSNLAEFLSDDEAHKAISRPAPGFLATKNDGSFG